MSDTSSEAVHSDGSTAEVTTDVNAAASSTTENEGVKSIHDVVNAALSETETPPGSGELGRDASTATTSTEEKPGAEGPVEPTEDELKQYSARVQSRIRELHSAQKEAIATADKASQELETLRPRAEQFERLEGYMHQHQISQEHFQNALSITAMINGGDHELALQTVMPIVQHLLEVTGRVLPPELQEKVETGYVTPDIAMQLQKERAKNANAEERSRMRIEQDEHNRKADEGRRMSHLYGTTATEWENAKKTSDPDWSHKGKLVSDLVERELLHRRLNAPDTIPRDAKSVTEILNAALKKVEEGIAPFRPKPQARDLMTGRAPTAGAKTKPTSLMDAVNQALSAG